MVSEDSTCTVLLRARCLLLLLLLAADSREWLRCAVCDITFKITCNMKRKQQNDFVPIRTLKNPAASKTHMKNQVFIYENSLYGPTSWTHTKGDTSEIAIVQPAKHSRTSPPGSRVSEHMPLYPSCVCLLQWAVSQAMATGALEA